MSERTLGLRSEFSAALMNVVGWGKRRERGEKRGKDGGLQRKKRRRERGIARWIRIRGSRGRPKDSTTFLFDPCDRIRAMNRLANFTIET